MAAVTILVAAAGASARMRGADKLLLPVGGEPLLRRSARAALAAGCRTLVALPPDRPERRAALAGLGAELLEVADAAEGMAASLRAGAAAAGETAGLMVHLADMPEIGAAEIARLASVFSENPDLPLRATAEDGRPGHPVIFPRRLFPALAALTGDRGARPVLAREEVRTLPLPGEAAVTDLDTPEDWAAFRARTGL